MAKKTLVLTKKTPNPKTGKTIILTKKSAGTRKVKLSNLA